MRIDTLHLCAAFGYRVKATCQSHGCGHRAVFEQIGLWWHFERKGWDGRFSAAHKRFRCTKCQQCRAMIEAVHEPVTRDPYPRPPEHELRRAANRLR
jgi:hypothetical protein